MTSQKILVTRSSMPSLQEYVAEIAPLWESHWLTNMGAKHQEFEKQLEDYLDANNVALFTNGHSALECALEALNLKGKVITTPFTFASTTHAIVRKGLQPVFADIKEDDYTLDPSKIEPLIDSDTCAILPVHVYGNLCDTDSIQAIADQYGLKVIYDAAHAFGVRRDGNPVANCGDISMFSFHATKVFNTIEGGALTFSDPELKEKLNHWKNFGITGPETVEYVGGNAKMNEFCAAMGLCNLRHVNQEIRRREEVVKQYRQRLEPIPGIKVSPEPCGYDSNYAYFPILIEQDYLGISRDKVFSYLEEHNIGARKYFYPLASDFSCYHNLFDSSLTPIAKKISASVLTLPLYADLPISTVDYICDLIIECTHN